MASMETHIRKLAAVNGGNVRTNVEKSKGANYPLPGTDTFYHTWIDQVPNFDRHAAYPWANGATDGQHLFKTVSDNVAKYDIDVRLNTSAQRLIADPVTREVQGIVVAGAHGTRRIKARRGVVLATGGFEGNAHIRDQFWEGTPILAAAGRTNTGDGIRMAQDLGANLWHMWHFHGCYGFKHPDPNYPYAIRVKRLPDWKPGREAEADVKMPWILLDRNGRRYMNEYQPYTQDTTQRPMHYFDPVTQSYPRNPSVLVCDEKGRKTYALGRPTSNDEGIRYDWSPDNMREIESGILKRADTLAELAELLGVDASRLEQSVTKWNAACASRNDEDFGRPGGTMMTIDTPPYYGAPVWCVVTNTQGGPVHDARQRIVDAFGAPIPRLYSAGELGSSFGHLYLSGGNIAECFVTGRVAGTGAAALPAWDDDRARTGRPAAELATEVA
jgi:succinate dehydrogenase/fumarate reductase flavoprotein subunit